MANNEYLGTRQIDALMNTAVVTGDFVLASGIRVNSKFDFDLILSDSDLFESVVAGLVKCIRSNHTNLDGIITVANGASRLGGPISQELGIPHFESSYSVDEDGNKVFSVDIGIEIGSVVIVDDVFTKGTNATKVANAALLDGTEIVGVVVILDRSGQGRPTILDNCVVNSLIRADLS